MFQIGCARVCLRDYLIQSSEEINGENLDILINSTQITNESMSIIETQPNISFDSTSSINAKLSIQITHQTHDLSDTAKLQYSDWLSKLITNICDENGTKCVRSLKLMQSKNK